MKNIHVLPTSNLSRLYYNFCKYQNSAFPLNKFCLRSQILPDNKLECKNHNIYITSDEEIKPSDYYLWKENEIIKANDIEISFHHTVVFDCKKIILTTDQDLIKDGVQAINDEFLEWFVKNPDCKEVEIKKEKVILGEVSGTTYTDFNYKIIIPREPEPDYTALLQPVGAKQEQKKLLIEMMQEDEELGLYDEPKQETLEEVAERLYPNYQQEIFIKGAKWQQEKSYSEEEVLDLLTVFSDFANTKEYVTFKALEEWFEQFKKK
jgi:hypothetical protein